MEISLYSKGHSFSICFLLTGSLLGLVVGLIVGGIGLFIVFSTAIVVRIVCCVVKILQGDTCNTPPFPPLLLSRQPPQPPSRGRGVRRNKYSTLQQAPPPAYSEEDAYPPHGGYSLQYLLNRGNTPLSKGIEYLLLLIPSLLCIPAISLCTHHSEIETYNADSSYIASYVHKYSQLDCS